MLSSHSVRRWSLRVLVAILIVLLIAVVALLVWARTGLMQAEEAPWEPVRSDPNLSVHEDDTAIVLRPAQDEPAGMGLAFYPGAKVEATAYASRLPGVVAQGGMTVVIIKPWLDLALFDRRDLDTFTQQAPEIGSWIVGGHSLGGVRACQLAGDADALLLGSYCASDVAGDIPALSLSGSEDGLSTPQKIAEAADRLPEQARTVEIDGANHAGFGDYGPQDGDGRAVISDEEMAEAVTSHTLDFAETLG